MGLLVLRFAAGLTGTLQGLLFLAGYNHSGIEGWAAGLILVASGLLVLAGFLTPIASAVQAVTTAAFAVSWLARPRTDLFAPPLALILLVEIATALALPGPGYLSVDSRMFGRREIIIPRERRPRT